MSSSDENDENEVNVIPPCADLDGPPCPECDQKRMECWKIIHWAWGVLENMPANLVSICRYMINMFLTLYISQHVRWANQTHRLAMDVQYEMLRELRSLRH